MPHRIESEQMRARVAALTLAALLHGLVLVALLLWGGVRPDPLRPPVLSATFSMADADGDAGERPEPLASSAPAKAVPPPLAPPTIDLPPSLIEDASEPAMLTPEFTTDPDPGLPGDAGDPQTPTALAGASGTACPLAAELRDALQRDPNARAALARIPRPARSVANAVMLWDAEWIAPERVGGTATIAAMRDAVALAMKNAPDECQTQTVMGPVFLPIQLEAGTIVLALGSGAWQWEDLLREDPPEGPSNSFGTFVRKK